MKLLWAILLYTKLQLAMILLVNVARPNLDCQY